MLLEGEFRNPAGCAISAIFDKTGACFSGKDIIDSIAVMRDRSNGLGGGFACYGIYPDKKDLYAFHVFFTIHSARKDFEEYISRYYEIDSDEDIPTRKIPEIVDEPEIRRYFVYPKQKFIDFVKTGPDECVFRTVFAVNTEIKGAYIFSSGKNMGIFKAVGFPEDVGRFYMLDSYEGYLFTAHGRYPTNTPGWWGGAHPFGLLGLSVVHNGEISSYDANRRAMEMYGYKCTLLTDTEVITYILDYLTRKKGLTFAESAEVIAAPFWERIDRMSAEDKARATYLRDVFSACLVTGPFSIIVGFDGGVMALNDRLKLRTLAVAEKGDKVYMASEEAAIRKVCPTFDTMFYAEGGKPIVYRVKGGKQ